MLVERRCMFTGILSQREMDVTPEQLKRWEEGELIQDVFPHLSVDEREFLISGTSSEQWEKIFGEEE